MPDEKLNKSNSGTKNMTNCIVVKFHDEMNIPYASDQDLINFLSEHFKMPWAAIFQKFPGIALKRMIRSITPDKLNELMNDAEIGSKKLHDKSYKVPKLHNFFRIECPYGMAKDELLKLIQNLAGVEYAYIQQHSVPGTGAVGSKSFAYKQRYLNPAPLGINAKFAWAQPGGKGEGANLQFIHIENGWDSHTDLQGWAAAGPIKPLTGFNVSSKDHGTKVLGIITAQHNGTGVNGITPNIDAAVVSQFDSDPPGDENPADAIAFAASKLKSGDIMLITLMGVDKIGNSVPLEYDKAVFEFVQAGTKKGIIVIEIAGNSTIDLAINAVFDKNQPLHYKDSGAIIVGAAKSTGTHKKMNNSNFGSRVNCFAWGERITTTTANNGYVFDFSETCGAASIIAGAAISIQSMYMAAKKNYFNCEEIRQIFSTKANGTSSPDSIGIMPDLKKIYENHIK